MTGYHQIDLIQGQGPAVGSIEHCNECTRFSYSHGGEGINVALQAHTKTGVYLKVHVQSQFKRP